MSRRSFSTAESLAEWLRGECEARTRFGYARLSEPNTLTLATEPAVATEDDPARSGRFVPIQLPAAEDAVDWWHALWEDREVIDFWVYRDWGAMSLIVAAKAGVWRPCATLHARLDVADFAAISYSDFRDLAGSDATHMMNEVALVGFSTRQVILPREPRPSRGSRVSGPTKRK